MRWRRNTLPAVLAAALSVLPPGRRNGFSHGGPTAVTEDSLSGAGGTAPAPDRPEPPSVSRPGERGAHTAAGRPDTGSAPGEPRQRLRAWAELLRVSALFSVPGDALAGAAAVGRRPGRGTALAIGASLCLYEAGMALNDWADRDEDAVDRPHRPIPSGRISPAAALGAAGVLTATGLALAARAGRPALTVATGLAATVWAYDLHLKHTKAGPAAMAAARSLDLLLGATATATGVRAPGGTSAPDNVAAATPSGLPACLPALPAALVLGAHTYGVTAVSRHETQGGSTGTPLAVLATTTALAAAVLRESGGTGPRPARYDEGGRRRRPRRAAARRRPAREGHRPRPAPGHHAHRRLPPHRRATPPARRAQPVPAPDPAGGRRGHPGHDPAPGRAHRPRRGARHRSRRHGARPLARSLARKVSLT